MSNEIAKEITKEPVHCTEVRMGNWQKDGTITAILKQKVTTVSTYPGAKHSNNMQQNPFAEQISSNDGAVIENTETRVAFLDVPRTYTVEQVNAGLPANSVLYKVMSNKPILTDNHQAAINSGKTTIDAIATSQVSRYGEGSANAGKLILDKAHGFIPQYRKIFFWSSPKEDIDLRGNGDAYASPDLLAEMGVDSDAQQVFTETNASIEEKAAAFENQAPSE